MLQSFAQQNPIVLGVNKIDININQLVVQVGQFKNVTLNNRVSNSIRRILCLSPKLQEQFKMPYFQYQLNQIKANISHQQRKTIADQYLTFGSQGTMLLIAKQKPVDSIAIGPIAFLCRYRTEPHSIAPTKKLYAWHQKLRRGNKDKVLLENGNYIFYSPPPETFSDSLRNMINQLVHQKWPGNYIGLFLPRSLQKQFFLLSLISEIKSLSKALTKRFQFVVFQTKPNSNFNPVLSNLQHHPSQLFKRQWFWVDQDGSKVSFSYRNCKAIENNPNDKVNLVVDIQSNLPTNIDSTHQLQVNKGILVCKNDLKKGKSFKVHFDGTSIFCQLLDNSRICLPAQYKNDRAFRTFIQRPKQINKLLTQKENQTIQRLQNMSFIKRLIYKLCGNGLPPITIEQVIQQKGQQWIQLQLKCVRIDKIHKTQTNLFTGFQRKIQYRNFSQQQFCLQHNKSFNFIELQTASNNQEELDKLLQSVELYPINRLNPENNAKTVNQVSKK